MSHLLLFIRQSVNPGASFAFFCIHRCDHASITNSFKLVKTRPMLWKVCRLEKVYVY
jgi:hypothetical protein